MKVWKNTVIKPLCDSTLSYAMDYLFPRDTAAANTKNDIIKVKLNGNETYDDSDDDGLTIRQDLYLGSPATIL